MQGDDLRSKEVLSGRNAVRDCEVDLAFVVVEVRDAPFEATTGVGVQALFVDFEPCMLTVDQYCDGGADQVTHS